MPMSYRQKLLHDLTREVNRERARARGCRVIMDIGEYKGREAEVTDVDVSMEQPYELLYLCMVLRADGTGHLNTHGDTRTFHPESNFKWIPEHGH